jgi:hypothetical protein
MWHANPTWSVHVPQDTGIFREKPMFLSFQCRSQSRQQISKRSLFGLQEIDRRFGKNKFWVSRCYGIRSGMNGARLDKVLLPFGIQVKRINAKRPWHFNRGNALNGMNLMASEICPIANYKVQMSEVDQHFRSIIVWSACLQTLYRRLWYRYVVPQWSCLLKRPYWERGNNWRCC